MRARCRKPGNAGESSSETGLYYYRARYYEPITGRFLSEDPLGFRASGPDRYGYVRNNAANVKDPLGLWGAGITGGFGAFGGLGGGASAGGSISAGGVYFANPSAPLGFTSAGFISQGGYVGPDTGDWGNPADAGNAGGGLGAGFGVGALLTNAKSGNDLAGPFTNTTILLPFLNIDFARAGKIWSLSVTAGPGWGFGFFHYCTNTWTNPVSDESFSHPGTPSGRQCGCNTGPE